jgi:uncharacterized oxidoreductase
MDISGNTILITGGATGIGYAIAESFLEAENEVIICGRREKKASFWMYFTVCLNLNDG